MMARVSRDMPLSRLSQVAVTSFWGECGTASAPDWLPSAYIMGMLLDGHVTWRLVRPVAPMVPLARLPAFSMRYGVIRHAVVRRPLGRARRGNSGIAKID